MKHFIQLFLYFLNLIKPQLLDTNKYRLFYCGVCSLIDTAPPSPDSYFLILNICMLNCPLPSNGNVFTLSINADLIVVVASVVVLAVGSKGQVFATSAVR